MKTKVELLEELGILDKLRQSFLKITEDAPKNWDAIDAIINRMTNDDILIRFVRWEIGDGRWWDFFKSKFDYLEQYNPDEK